MKRIKCSPYTSLEPVEDAAYESLSQYDFYDGQIEAVQSKVDNANKLLARLMQHLADNGMSAKDVYKIISGYENNEAVYE